MARKRKPYDESEAFRPTLGALLQRAGVAGADGSDAPEAARTPPDLIGETAAPDLSACDKVTIRLERKGRRGKVVTLVQGLGAIKPAGLKVLARRWRQRLGCGATVEPECIVLQGDQRERIGPLVEAAGGRAKLSGT